MAAIHSPPSWIPRRSARTRAERDFSRLTFVHKSKIVPHPSPLIAFASSSAWCGTPLHRKCIASVPGGKGLLDFCSCRNARDCKCGNNCGDRNDVEFGAHGDVSSGSKFFETKSRSHVDPSASQV